MSVISIMGRNARALLQSLERWTTPWCAPPRITYVGELGWQLYIPTEHPLLMSG